MDKSGVIGAGRTLRDALADAEKVKKAGNTFEQGYAKGA